MSEICVHQVKVISHCNWSSPLVSSTQQRGRRSTSTKAREMVSVMHFFPLINLWLMSIFYTERLTEVEGAEMEDSPANEWLQGSRFISLSSETLVLLTTVNVFNRFS